MSSEVPFSGHIKPGFESVKDAYLANFSRGDAYEELGSSLCVYHKGERVVDIWAGYQDREKKKAWKQDTTICVYSTTKGIAGICTALLVDRRLLNYNDLVSKHWPEFGQQGKESTTVSHLLSHQSGNPALREDTAADDLMNWELICKRLASQAPYWVPGENTAYHGWTYGYLVGEIVRRVSGKSIGQFLQDEICERLGADVYIGLPEDKDAKAAILYGPTIEHGAPPNIDELPDFVIRALSNPVMEAESPNRREWRAAEMPATCGYASGEGLAKIYNILAENGESHGTRLMSPETLNKMTETASSRVDVLLGAPAFWANGVLNNNLNLYGPNPNAFGYSGWGGSFGCADRDNNVAIGFVCNQMGPDFVGDARTIPIVEAIYNSI